ncbi:MAG: hypothetical protein Q4C64_02480 [Erysipelotrichia bacterium]|nr:hypothetical protein [Erysipelotrichia bacterium]
MFKIVMALLLLSTLNIKYASISYFSKPIEYYIINETILGWLIIATSACIVLSELKNIKFLNNYVLMFLTMLDLVSWWEFYNEQKIITLYDVNNQVVVEAVISKAVFIIPIILIIIFITLLVQTIIKKQSVKK